jgi:Carboxypeptidase regulatory-like domain
MRSLIVALSLCLPVVVAPAHARGEQGNPGGTLHVTVVDSTGAVIVGATVTVAGADDATKSATLTPVQTSAQGVATITRLVPGRYSVQAEFPGFATGRLAEVRVRNGDNKQVLLLQIEGVKQAVVVEQNRQAAAADPRGPSFGTTLTREQLEALSDDPEVLRQQLQDMAGPGAVIKVDSFEGAALPPKSQIRSIRISRDQFAAEYHSAGGTQIEIITQPGLGPIRLNTGLRFRSASLSGRNALTGQIPPEQFRNYSFGGGGTLLRNKSSFGFFVNGTDSYDTPNINVATPSGTRSEALAIRAPRDNLNVFTNVDYALTLDQTLRFGFNMERINNRNLGIGQFDAESRAYSTESTFGQFRAQQIGPLGRRAFTRTRLQYSWFDTDSFSTLEAPTIRVNDAFTTGGAQVAGGRHSRTLTIGADLDYVRGIHTWRTGLLFDAARWQSDDTLNYLGTYTFEGLEAFEAGRPRSYTRRVGDPNVRYQNYQGALYVQDDVRVRRNLTLSAGIRYEAQTHVHDFDNVMPRLGITWAPFAAGQTTLRASWGIFHDWLATNTYEQTLRLDGLHQREVDIIDPPYPDLLFITGPPNAAFTPPVNRYLLGDDLELQRTSRVSLGIDQRLARTTQSSVIYSYTRGGAFARGSNLNAPIDGERPDPAFGNIVEVVSDARSLQHQLQVNVTANPGALLPIANARSAPLVNFKRTTVFFNYTYSNFRNDTDGPFSLAPFGDLELEWGPGPGDIPHRLNFTVNNQIVKSLLVSFNLTGASGAPFTIRTGFDDNGDLVFNDRPEGVGRNSERGADQWSINGMIGYVFAFGKSGGAPPGIAVIGAGTAPVVQSVDMGPRYRLQFFVQSQNVTNHPNYIAYSGTMNSLFFGRPTNVAPTRKVEAGMNFSF